MCVYETLERKDKGSFVRVLNQTVDLISPMSKLTTMFLGLTIIEFVLSNKETGHSQVQIR